MTLREQWQELDTSKVVQATAKAFLVGFGVAVAPMLIPAVHDFGSFMNEMLARLWWYRFFSCGMSGGLGFAFGQYLRSPFDTVNSSNPTKTIDSLPPKS